MARRPKVSFTWVVTGLAVAVAATLLVRAPWRSEPVSAPRPGPSPTSSAEASIAPPCRFGDRPARPRGFDDWAVTLVDPELRLPRGYEPPDLVSTTDAGFPTDVPIREVVLDDLRELRRAARSEGIHLDVTFGYRSHRLQELLFAEWSERRGERRARATVARAGHSEHQLGTALDFTTAGTGPPDPGWGSTREGAWLAEHAGRFGFVLSYPKGRRSVTCYAPEPWHVRYVGREHAARLAESGLTLREYLWCLREPEGPCATLVGG